MTTFSKAIFITCIVAAVSACDKAEKDSGYVSEPVAPPQTDESSNVLEINARGMRFEGADSIPSGWTTIRLNNMDNMLHFAMVVRLPDGVTANMYSDDLGSAFQEGYNLMLEGKNEEVAAVFGSIPEWVPELSYHGGPGFISGNRSAESTQYLEPGNYLVECYIKSNGIFHSFSPVPNQLAMLLPFEVTEKSGNMAEPEANATLKIDETGIHLTEGALVEGANSIRVKFDTQIRFPSFVGQDVHVVRIEDEADAQAAKGWMDWRTPDGLQVPSPVTFVGGINDVMPAGSAAYFSVDLEPGKYAFIGEVPEADQKGMYMEFSIP